MALALLDYERKFDNLVSFFECETICGETVRFFFLFVTFEKGVKPIDNII